MHKNQMLSTLNKVFKSTFCTAPAAITHTATASAVEANMAKNHKVVMINKTDTNISVSKLKTLLL